MTAATRSITEKDGLLNNKNIDAFSVLEDMYVQQFKEALYHAKDKEQFIKDFLISGGYNLDKK